MDAERRRWLERVALACERLIADAREHPTDAHFVALRKDTDAFLARIQAELDAG
jgi:hypothetical protein